MTVSPPRSGNSRVPPDMIVGLSPSFSRALHQAKLFAGTGLSILLVGETGTGKELFARQVHRWSRRGPFVDLNCGAIPRDLVEGQLFGHRRGAFTGAVESVDGLVAAAHNGTLFLDEIPSLTLEAQVKLLRTLETGEVRRIGEPVKRFTDFRVVAAAQPSIAVQLRTGQFRQDLFYRIAGVVITIPPLSHRKEDIMVLAHHFAAALGRELDDSTKPLLLDQEWCGNVRELRAVIERAAVLAPNGVIDRAAIREAFDLGLIADQTVAPGSPWQNTRERLLEAATRSQADRRLTAAALGISVATLYRLLRETGISLGQIRREQRQTGSHNSHAGSTADENETANPAPRRSAVL